MIAMAPTDSTDLVDACKQRDGRSSTMRARIVWCALVEVRRNWTLDAAYGFRRDFIHPNYFGQWMRWVALVALAIPSAWSLYGHIPLVAWEVL